MGSRDQDSRTPCIYGFILIQSNTDNTNSKGPEKKVRVNSVSGYEFLTFCWKFECRESVHNKGALPCLTSMFMVIHSRARTADRNDLTI